jgi:hypothetical protein
MNKVLEMQKEYKDYFATTSLGLESPKTNIVVELFDPNNVLVGHIWNIESLHTVRIYIAENSLSGWYCVFKSIKIPIGPNGDIKKWPEGFFDQQTKLLTKLLKIQTKRRVRNGTIRKLVKVLHEMRLDVGDKISPIKFFTTAQLLGIFSADQFVDIGKSKHYLNMLRQEGYVSMTDKKYFTTTKMYYEKNSNS